MRGEFSPQELSKNARAGTLFLKKGSKFSSHFF